MRGPLHADQKSHQDATLAAAIVTALGRYSPERNGNGDRIQLGRHDLLPYSDAPTHDHVGGERHHRSMPLTLVLGPANSAKAGEVLGAFSRAARRGAMLVVPTAQDAEHYARELAGDGAMLGSVVTFSGLAAEMARRTDYAGRRVSALQREHILRRVIGRLELRALGESAPAPRVRARRGRADRRAPALAHHPPAVRPGAVRVGRPGRPPRRLRPRRRVAVSRASRTSSSGAGASTPSCTRGERSTRSAPRPAGGARRRCSCTASTT